jgi:membrane-associated protease RseP (regulator of RpoE activity)
MEEEKRNIYTIVAIVVVLGVLFSCVAGTLAGGVTGFLAGSRQGRIAAERALEQAVGGLPGFWRWDESMPGPGPGRRPLPPDIMPPSAEGALITEVISGTPADEAGLQAGDIITAVDRTPIDADHPLSDVVGQYVPGDRATVHFQRANAEDSVRVKLAAHPDDPDRAYLGIYFQPLAEPGLELPRD